MSNQISRYGYLQKYFKMYYYEVVHSEIYNWIYFTLYYILTYICDTSNHHQILSIGAFYHCINYCEFTPHNGSGCRLAHPKATPMNKRLGLDIWLLNGPPQINARTLFHHLVLLRLLHGKDPLTLSKRPSPHLVEVNTLCFVFLYISNMSIKILHHLRYL